MNHNVPSLEIVSSKLTYDPESGLLRWRDIFWVGSAAGKIAGPEASHDGYIRIRLNRRQYLGHRLAVLLMTGSWPGGLIDHINGNRSDNRWSNLRVVSNATNMQNQHKAHKDSKTGLLGIKWQSRSKKWEARIVVCGKTYYIGRSLCMHEAHQMYLQAKTRLHPGSFIQPNGNGLHEKPLLTKKRADRIEAIHRKVYGHSH